MFNRWASLAMSTSVLKSMPGKLDIKRHSQCSLYLGPHCLQKHLFMVFKYLLNIYFFNRAAEEKRHQEEEQRMVVAGKRVPTVSVQPMREGNLAPWQRELQGNN